MSASTSITAQKSFGILNGELLGLQSWYFGYVLAFSMVLTVFFFINISKKKWKHCILWIPSVFMIGLCVVILVLNNSIKDSAQHMAHVYEVRFSGREGVDVSYNAENVVHYFLYNAGTSR